jgi:hypothetical protein
MVPDIMGHYVVEIAAKVVRETGKELGNLDLWWQEKFGRSLSGRMHKLEIQTLFHGNTKDEEQI